MRILKFFLGIFIIIALVEGAGIFLLYRQNTILKQSITSQITVDEVSMLVTKVGKHILLPVGETPTVMTVTDKEKLSGQLFFSQAKNGDKVLVYATTKKAFLYNVQSDRVLEVGPVTFDSVPSSSTGSSTIRVPVSPEVLPISPFPTGQ